jgi:hypothetical protein
MGNKNRNPRARRVPFVVTSVLGLWLAGACTLSGEGGAVGEAPQPGLQPQDEMRDKQSMDEYAESNPAGGIRWEDQEAPPLEWKHKGNDLEV